MIDRIEIERMEFNNKESCSSVVLRRKGHEWTSAVITIHRSEHGFDILQHIRCQRTVSSVLVYSVAPG
jgi:hypothetical protein